MTQLIFTLFALSTRQLYDCLKYVREFFLTVFGEKKRTIHEVQTTQPNKGCHDALLVNNNLNSKSDSGLFKFPGSSDFTPMNIRSLYFLLKSPVTPMIINYAFNDTSTLVSVGYCSQVTVKLKRKPGIMIRSFCI